MRNRTFLACVLGFAMLLARPAAADTILFDPDGSGTGALTVDSFDWQQGNTMLMETSATNGVILFQSNLDSALDGATTDFSQGDGGFFFTAVASFNVTLVAPGVYSIDPGGTFRIYATSTNGDSLTGLGFADGSTTCDGTGAGGCILEGSATNSITNLVSVLAIPGTQFLPVSDPDLACGTGTSGSTHCLDQFNGDPGSQDYPNIFTFFAVGGTHLEAVVTSFDPNYFLNLVENTTIAINNTNNNLPFNGVDPSGQFSIDAIQNGGTLGASLTNPFLCGPGGAADCINGTGTNILAQTDLTTTFSGIDTPNVPEPATLTLLGLGLLGSAAARRRQLKKKSQEL